VAFEPSIEVSNNVVASTGAYFNSPSPIFYTGAITASREILFASTYIASGAAIFTTGLDIGRLEKDFSVCYINQASAVFTNGEEVYVYALPTTTGDTGQEIVVGLKLDFAASPRRGPAKLDVQFTNQAGGPWIEFIWDFGDGNAAYSTSPSNTYELVGLYTVTITGRIGLQSISFTRRSYIRVYPGGLIVARTTRCFRNAVLPEQGVGFNEVSGSAWPMPEARTGTLRIFDSNDQPHVLVLDNKDGYFYDISTRDGPPESSLTRVWKDKVATDGTGGTEILPEAQFPEDRGGFEHYFLEHKESHVYARPYDELVGYPSGLELSLSIFEDGEQTDASATASNIPLDGDISYDKIVEAHRLMMVVSANKSQHVIVGRQQYYVAKDRAAGPDDRIMTESDYEEEFALPLLWFWMKEGTEQERATGATLTLTVTAVAGIDGGSESGASFTTAQNFGSVGIGGLGEFMFWYKGTIAVTLGGAPIAITDHGTYSGWTLGYSTNITGTGDVVLTPTGTGIISDMRVFGTAITSGARSYYYNDVSTNGGGVVLPS